MAGCMLPDMTKYRPLGLPSSDSMEFVNYMKTSLLIQVFQSLPDFCIVTSQAIDIKLHNKYVVLANQNLTARRLRPVASLNFACIER